jgi:CubicO group peptidase (beta-lactamase class C family)
LGSLVRAVDTRRAPGVAAAWSAGDGTVSVGSAGDAELDPPRDMTGETACPWFSVTKLFTATAVLQLAEAGKLDLDEPIASVRPGLPGDAAARLTPRQLLSHTSGLSNPMPLRWVHLATEPGPGLESMTTRLLGRYRKLRFEPGTRYAYSNLGYLVLGLLIERVSGLGFETYISRNVLKPLGATASGFDMPPDAARGYSRAWSIMGIAARLLIDRKVLGATRGGFTALRPFQVDGAPYGGLVGPVTDMLLLGRAMLKDGRGAEGRVLDAATVRPALTPARSRDGRTLPVGLGWHLGASNGEPYAHHIGGGLGFRSELRIYPRLGRAIAVIANETSFATGAVAERVAVPGS